VAETGRKLEHDPEKWKPVFRKACPRARPGRIMLKQQSKARMAVSADIAL
jgi:hypothetical protein